MNNELYESMNFNLMLIKSLINLSEVPLFVNDIDLKQNRQKILIALRKNAYFKVKCIDNFLRRTSLIRKTLNKQLIHIK
jgi:hypothetical protein